jgi:hypothetical protein
MLEKLLNSWWDACKSLEQLVGRLKSFGTAGGMLEKLWNSWWDA